MTPSPGLQPLTAGLLECVTARDVARVIVDRGAAVLGATAGLLALVSEDGRLLEIVQSQGYPADVQVRWRSFPIDANLPLSNAVRQMAPLFTSSRAEWAAIFPHLTERNQDTNATADLPLIEHGRVLGALHLSFRDERVFDDADREFLDELVQQCSLAMGRALARQQADDARRRMEFLVRASEVLTESLDYSKTLHQLAHLVVPELSDYAQVAIVDGGAIDRIAVAHELPEREAVIRELYTLYPPDPTHPNSVGSAIRTGEVQHMTGLTDEIFVKAAVDEHHLSLLRQLALTDTLTIPLSARGRTLGAMTFAMSSESGRSFRPSLISFLQELSRRAAMAIDNARLYQDAEREISERKIAEAARERAVRQREDALIENARLMTEAVEASRQQREFQVNMLSSMTDGRLILCESPGDLPSPAPRLEMEATIQEADDIFRLRQAALATAVRCGFADERTDDLLTAVSEACMNAYVHAGGGDVRVRTDGECGVIQVWIVDRGKGIDYSRLPDAMFRKGYSSAGTLGHGFKLIISFADFVYVLTGPGGTTVVIEQHRSRPEPAWA
ncbi:hypothetical protein CCAX7_57380 [Capsulimonas corticalis]|uniref:Uncharacterized protein n=2 Tax=Capsulimonas corticalis TaxID=2219043 RepID=A0A402D082_9BACT|nr:hypothetical protein CCAX7_57380 [Capsulimonas corticalis]